MYCGEVVYGHSWFGAAPKWPVLYKIEKNLHGHEWDFKEDLGRIKWEGFDEFEIWAVDMA